MCLSCLKLSKSALQAEIVFNCCVKIEVYHHKIYLYARCLGQREIYYLGMVFQRINIHHLQVLAISSRVGNSQAFFRLPTCTPLVLILSCQPFRGCQPTQNISLGMYVAIVCML